MSEKTYLQALNEALRQEMERDENVFILGEDVGQFGGCFGVTQGLFDEFGEGRVMDTPITESAIVGAAAGAAACGLRPVAELMFVDFIGVSMDQLFNQAAKMRFMFGGKAKVPMTLLYAPGSWHRRSGPAFAEPGVLVHEHPGPEGCYPFQPLRCKRPAYQCHPRRQSRGVSRTQEMLYGVTGEVPDESYTIEIGKADIKREGSDVTIVATSQMVYSALEAAEMLKADGIEAEVVDPALPPAAGQGDHSRIRQEDPRVGHCPRGRSVCRSWCRNRCHGSGRSPGLPGCAHQTGRRTLLPGPVLPAFGTVLHSRRGKHCQSSQEHSIKQYCGEAALVASPLCFTRGRTSEHRRHSGKSSFRQRHTTSGGPRQRL